MASRSRERILSLYSASIRPAWSTVLNPGVLKGRKHMDHLELTQRRIAKIIRGMEHLSYEERLKDLELFSLEKIKIWGDLTVAF